MGVGALHFFMSRLANNFAEIYADSPQALPWMTRVLIHDTWFYWVVPLVVAGSVVAHHLGYVGPRATTLIAGLGTVASIVIAVCGLYLPTIYFGRMVGG